MADGNLANPGYHGSVTSEDDELDALVRNRLPIILSWHKGKTIRLGTCLHSTRLRTENPWEEEESPFLLAHLYRVPPILTRESGTVASFKSISTSRQCQTRDHLALGFGVGVGLPFLASVSVKGTYDRDVQNNEDVGLRSCAHLVWRSR